MKIESSLDWNTVHSQLRIQISQLNYNPDLHKMLNNITNMVTVLSQLEVDARRTQKLSYVETKLNEINKAIDHLEKILLIAKLMN